MPVDRSYNMSRIRSKNTKPEMKLRKALHGAGFRFRVNVRRLPGTPDIVLAKYHTVVFVNGCFWHGHQGCSHYTHPKTNPEFWAAKVTRNQQRDAIDNARLKALGWQVITVWECELHSDRFEATMETLTAQLPANIGLWKAWKAERRKQRQAGTKRSQRLANVPKSIVKLSEAEE